MYTQRSGGWCLLTGENCPVYGYNDFQSSKIALSVYYVIVTWEEGPTLYVCGGSHLYEFYLAMARKMLANALRLEEISMPSNSVFFGHRYMQYARLGWKKTHDLRRRPYLLDPSTNSFKGFNRICLGTKLLLPTVSNSEDRCIWLRVLTLIFVW